MKRTLLATTVLAGAGMLALSAGDANAQAKAPAAEKMKLSLGGFMIQYLGYADQDGDWESSNNSGGRYVGFDTKSDTEVYFSGSLQLDNGLTVAVRIDLESDVQTAAGTVIDESYMSIGSATLGTLTIGSTDTASGNLQVQAPSVGHLNFYNNDMPAWVLPGGGAASGTSTGHAISGGTDDNLVKYVSPSFAGFRVGGSYTPSSTDSATQPTSSETALADVGAQYSGKFGDFGLRVSGLYWQREGATDAAQLDGWAVGADVTFADFTLGGAYGEQNQNGSNAIAVATTSSELDTWNIGVKYDPGPFAIGLTYARQTSPGSAADPDDSTYSRWALGATYDLGPGVTLSGQILRAVSEVETSAQALENSAWAAVGGIKVDF